MKRYVAAMDIGTSGCKAVIVDDAGGVVAAATVEYPLYSPRPGWNEQEPQDWWNATCASLKQALAKSGVDPKEIAALSLSGQMHGIVPLDRDDKVIRRAFLWNDQRCAKQCADALARVGGLDALLGYTNNNLLTGYQAGKILWLRDEEPENYRRMTRALLPKDYIRFMLTDDFASDVSDMSGTGLFDVKNRTISRGLLEKLDLSPDLFPRVVESDEITGEITSAAAALTGLAKGTPVVGGGGDAVIQTTGMGLIKDGVLGLTLGTAGIVAMGLTQYLDNAGGTMQFFCNNAKDLYHVMGVQLAGGGSYQWYRSTLCGEEMRRAKEDGLDHYAYMDEAAAKSPAGANRLLYLPYLSGERCPYADPNLRAGFIGLSQTHVKGDMTRAVMEGVTYGLRQITAAILRLKPIDMKKVVLSGGGSRSDLWRQIVSDIFQLPVYTVSGASEGGAYGASLVGGVGAGLWKNLDDACGRMKVETVNEPQGSHKGVYDEMYAIYDDMVPALKPQFDRLAVEK